MKLDDLQYYSIYLRQHCYLSLNNGDENYLFSTKLNGIWDYGLIWVQTSQRKQKKEQRE